MSEKESCGYLFLSDFIKLILTESQARLIMVNDQQENDDRTTLAKRTLSVAYDEQQFFIKH